MPKEDGLVVPVAPTILGSKQIWQKFLFLRIHISYCWLLRWVLSAVIPAVVERVVSKLKLAIVPKLICFNECKHKVFSTWFSSVPLKTFLLWRLEVITLKLGHFDLPGSGCARRPSVNVKIDHVAGVGGGNPHMLPGVVATDDWRCGAPWVTDSHCVCIAVSKFPA